jgi:hypothetical protein
MWWKKRRTPWKQRRDPMHKASWTMIVAACLLGHIYPVSSQESVNPHSLAIQDFEKRIEDYMKLRKAATAEVPRLKTTDAPEKISDHEKSLSGRIREARPDARKGNVFTPEIQAEFQRLIGLAMPTPKDAARIKKSLRRAEPVQLRLRVNDVYPANVPLQSTPPSLILSLPKLPPELEYRITGRDLVIRDIEANLIVDFIAGAIP